MISNQNRALAIIKINSAAEEESYIISQPERKEKREKKKRRLKQKRQQRDLAEGIWERPPEKKSESISLLEAIRFEN